MANERMNTVTTHPLPTQQGDGRPPSETGEGERPTKWHSHSTESHDRPTRAVPHLQSHVHRGPCPQQDPGSQLGIAAETRCGQKDDPGKPPKTTPPRATRERPTPPRPTKAAAPCFRSSLPSASCKLEKEATSEVAAWEAAGPGARLRGT